MRCSSFRERTREVCARSRTATTKRSTDSPTDFGQRAGRAIRWSGVRSRAGDRSQTMAVEDSALGSLLRRRRASAGLTQEDLAERAGISIRTVSDIERGLRSRIYPVTAERLASALGLEGQDRSQFAAVARGRPSPVPEQESDIAPGGLPSQPTRLIGREPELELIQAT